jgi:hypothetical protein
VGGDRGGGGSSDYGGRLRRTRLGLIVGLVASSMLFVSFTSVLHHAPRPAFAG